jgi:hypothetical protein
MSITLPPARLPHLPLPNIHALPTIPSVGCAGGNGATYIGEQFGDLPDLNAISHIKALKKSMDEQIYALIKGELPDAARPAVYAARAAQLVSQVASLVSLLNTLTTSVTAEAQASISFCNAKIAEMNQAKSALQNIPESARTNVQRLMLTRYNEYASELNGQIARLNSTIDCVAS